MTAHRPRRIRIRVVRRDPPDLKKLSRALIALAQAQAEKEAEEQHHRDKKPPKKRSGGKGRS